MAFYDLNNLLHSIYYTYLFNEAIVVGNSDNLPSTHILTAIDNITFILQLVKGLSQLNR
jgi:hypothetical protein